MKLNNYNYDTIQNHQPNTIQVHDNQKYKAIKKYATIVIIFLISVVVILMFDHKNSMIQLSSEKSVINTPKIELDHLGRYVIRNYDLQKEFASFLPGIAGKWGKPSWAFYINRGKPSYI